MKNNNDMSEKKTIKTTGSNPWALVPVGVFLVLYLISSLVAGDFYKMPLTVSFLVAGLVAMAMNTRRPLSEKTETFAKGMGNSNIMIMCMIFIMAGGFAQIARDMGAVDATVNLGLRLLPGNVLLAGIFLVACFISLSVGTSLGTVVALGPMAIGMAEKLGMPLGLALGATVGGAMFGDNLSMISDTTIAAARTQGCAMRDKFRVNFLIVLPAAILSFIIYVAHQKGAIPFTPQEGDAPIMKVMPYLFVLGAALAGMNVIIVLFLGSLLAGIIGLAYGSFDLWGLAQAIGTGISGMSEIIIISLLVGGMVEIIKYNGGIDFLLHLIGKKAHNRKSAEYGIAALTSIVNVFTANNTITIVMAGPIVKDIASKYGIRPRRAASIMDTFSCFVQGLLPYGAQILAAVGIAGTTAITPLNIMQYLYYPYLMGGCALLAIAIGWPRFKD